MAAKHSRRWLLAGIASLFWNCVPPAVAADGPTPAIKLDNASCQICHDGGKGDLSITDAKGKKHALHSVNGDKMERSVHAKMQCVDCHQDITNSASPHTSGSIAKADCVQCHQSLWDTVRKENKTKENPGLGYVATKIESQKQSIHAKVNKDEPTPPVPAVTTRTR